jgi:hypothetical protein
VACILGRLQSTVGSLQQPLKVVVELYSGATTINKSVHMMALFFYQVSRIEQRPYDARVLRGKWMDHSIWKLSKPMAKQVALELVRVYTRRIRAPRENEGAEMHRSTRWRRSGNCLHAVPAAQALEPYTPSESQSQCDFAPPRDTSSHVAESPLVFASPFSLTSN